MVSSQGTFGRYWVGHGLRIGWYLGQYMATSRLTRPRERARRASRPKRGTIGLGDLVVDVLDLLRRDWANIRAGRYPVPADTIKDPLTAIAQMVRYFTDLPAVNARRRRNGFDDVRRLAPAAPGLPAYYLRNFHFQTDGYLSARSARLYDHQVEVLFLGSADAMRRQALAPIADRVRAAAGRPLRVLDVGCGTGRFLAVLAQAFPSLQLIGVDLSHPYLCEARRHTRTVGRVTLVRALGEALPMADGVVDVATSVYVLHELPAEIRRRWAGELGRVVAAGGLLLVVDSLQFGDHPPYDRMIEGFPRSFHEPFYDAYARTDLTELFAAAGFRAVAAERAFLSKVMVFERDAGRD